MIDKMPAVIVQCAAEADIPLAIAYARANGLELSIRGAGHNIAGNSVSDGGLVIDFSQMKAVSVGAAISALKTRCILMTTCFTNKRRSTWQNCKAGWRN